MSCSVQVSFASLKSRSEVNALIEKRCCIVQELCVRASHLANHTVIRSDFDPSDYHLVTTQMWWRHCMMINTFTKNKGGPKPKYNEVLLKAHEDIQSIHSQEGIDVTLMGGTITDAAEMLSQCAKRMVHGQFKKLPSKAIIRQIILAMKKGTISSSSKEKQTRRKMKKGKAKRESLLRYRTPHGSSKCTSIKNC